MTLLKLISKRGNLLFATLVYSLLFLWGANFFSWGIIFLSILIAVVLIKMLVLGEFRITAGIIGIFILSTILTIASVIFDGFAYKDLLYYFVLPIGAFLFGSGFIRNSANIKQQIFNSVFFLFLGFFAHLVLSLGYSYYQYGSLSNLTDIWNGAEFNIDIMAIKVLLMVVVFFPILLFKGSSRKWYHLIIVTLEFILGCYFALAYANEIIVLGIGLSFLATILVGIVSKQYRKMTVILTICCVVLGGVFALLIFNNVFSAHDLIMRIPMINHKWTIFSPESRNLCQTFFEYFFRYLAGGKSMPINENLMQYMNAFMMIDYRYGLLALLAFVVIIVVILIKAIEIIRKENNKLIVSISTAIIAALFLCLCLSSVAFTDKSFFLIIILLFGLINQLAIETNKHFIRKTNFELPEFSKECKIVFVTNYLSLHQIPLCRALIKKYEENFSLVLCQEDDSPYVKKSFGTQNNHNIEIKQVYNYYEEKEKCDELLDESHVIIQGNDPKNLVRKQLKKGKLCFKYSERIYKKNHSLAFLSPRSLFSRFKNYEKLKNYPLFYLSASAYLPRDLDMMDFDTTRCYKWGYFTLDCDSDYEQLIKKKSHDKIELLHANRLIGLKHPEKCILVAKHLKSRNIDFRLRIVGIGDERIITKLNQEIEENNLQDSVFLLGPRGYNEVLEMMEETNIYLSFSNFNEGWGATTNEAMARGCVVLATHSQGSVPYLIEHKVNGLIYELNDDARMLELINYACDNSARRVQIGEKAYSTMKSTWSATNAVENFNLVLNGILQKDEVKIENGPMSAAPILSMNYEIQQTQLRKNPADNQENNVENTADFNDNENEKESIIADIKPIKEKSGVIRKGAIVSYIATFLTIISGILYTPWMIEQLTDIKYSIYTLAISIPTMFVLDFGLSEAVSRFLAKYRIEGDTKKVNNFLGLTFKLFFIIDALIFIALLVMFFLINPLHGKTFDNNSELISQLKIVYVIFGLHAVISFGMRPLHGVLIAYEKFSFNKMLSVIQRLLLISLSVTALLTGAGLYGVVIVYVFSDLFCRVISFIYTRKKLHLKPNLKFWDKAMTKEIFKFSLWSTIISICGTLMLSISPSLISIFSPKNAALHIAFWGVGVLVDEYSYMLTDNLNGLFLPRLTRMNANKTNEQKFTDLMIMVGRIQLVIMGLIFVGYVAVGRGFMHLWKGPEYDMSFFIGLILIIPFLVTLPQRTGVTLLTVKGELKYNAFSSIISVIVRVAIGIVCIILWGAVGAALGIAIGKIAGGIIYFNWALYKKGGIDIAKFFKNVHFKLLIPLIVTLLFGVALDFILPSSNWPLLGIKILAIVGFYFIILWKFSFNRQEKRLFFTIMLPIYRLFEAIK